MGIELCKNSLLLRPPLGSHGVLSRTSDEASGSVKGQGMSWTPVGLSVSKNYSAT
jgi:hypothetical protein